MKRFSRRSFALSAAASALASPFVRPGGASAATPPRRLVLVFTPCGYGVNWDDWARKTGPGPGDFTFGQTFASLTPHKADITILDGVDMKAGSGGPGGNHERGAGQVWTGTPLWDGTNDPNYRFATGISVDQHIAQKLGSPTKFPSLEIGVQTGKSGSTFNRTAYSGFRKAVSPEKSPLQAYSRIFTGVTTMPGMQPTIDPRLQQKRSVLDHVRGELEALRKELAAEDRIRLESHLTSLRQLESSLSTTAGGAGAVPGATCGKPTLPATLDVDGNDNFPQVGKLQSEIVAMALACDLTRVVNFQWSGAHSGTAFTWLNIGIQKGHHSISHLESDGGGPSPVEKYRAISKWYADQFAALVGRLKAIPEGNGTLLDNTLVVWGNEVTEGTFHRQNRVPFVLAGGRNMKLAPGRYATFNAVPHNNLLVTLCHAMGVVDQTTFGDARFCTGALPLLA